MTQLDPEPAVVDPPLPPALRAVGAAVFAAVAAASAVFELLYIPLRDGRLLIPLSIPLAVAANVLIVRGAQRVGSTAVAGVAVGVWLIVFYVGGFVQGPGGDVIIEGGNGEQYVGMLALLFGFLAGLGAITFPPGTLRRVTAADVRRIL